MDNFRQRTALITGASSGIGLEFARQLAGRGARVLLVARSEPQLEALASELRTAGHDAHVLPCDLARPDAAEQLHEAVQAAGHTVDLLVNNAGYGRWGDFADFPRDDYGQMIRLNVTALTDLCHLFMPGMAARGNGGVINVGSTASFLPVPYAAVYSATKAYVLLLSEALAFEYRDNGVHVMALCPGATESNFRAVATHNKDTAKSAADQSAESVAREGLDAFLAGRTVFINGSGNRRTVRMTRLLSRKRVLNMVGNLFARRVGKT